MRIAILMAALMIMGCSAGPDADGYHLDIDHRLYKIFVESFPDKKALLSLRGDCNNDGIEDLVIVYKESDYANKMITVYSYHEAYKITEPIPAPVEHCQLQWKDIDERPPVELLVSGQKGIHIGYAVFRLVDGQWISLFGEGMERCC